MAEASFPRAERTFSDPLSNGRENLRPSRWYPSVLWTRRARARNVRVALGRLAAAANGALGISSRTRAVRGRARRTATRAPPALMLRAVANSRKSLPFSSLLRTKTGIARGSRVHFLRSFSNLRRAKSMPLKAENYPCLMAHIGPNERISPENTGLCLQTDEVSGGNRASCAGLREPGDSSGEARGGGGECR